MKKIQPSNNSSHWPRCAIKSIECRPKDLIVRISDWWKTRSEPAYDVEVYIGGVYDFNESRTFAKSSGLTKSEAKARASQFAAEQLAKLL